MDSSANEKCYPSTVARVVPAGKIPILMQNLNNAYDTEIKRGPSSEREEQFTADRQKIDTLIDNKVDAAVTRVSRDTENYISTQSNKILHAIAYCEKILQHADLSELPKKKSRDLKGQLSFDSKKFYFHDYVTIQDLQTEDICTSFLNILENGIKNTVASSQRKAYENGNRTVNPDQFVKVDILDDALHSVLLKRFDEHMEYAFKTLTKRLDEKMNLFCKESPYLQYNGSNLTYLGRLSHLRTGVNPRKDYQKLGYDSGHAYNEDKDKFSLFPGKNKKIRDEMIEITVHFKVLSKESNAKAESFLKKLSEKDPEDLRASGGMFHRMTTINSQVTLVEKEGSDLNKKNPFRQSRGK